MSGRIYTLTERQLDLILSCIARAEVEGAFKDCVTPRIGQMVMEMLEKKRQDPA